MNKENAPLKVRPGTKISCKGRHKEVTDIANECGVDLPMIIGR